MIDGSIIRAHRHGSGARGGQHKQGLGRSCGGFSSKIHAKVDQAGFPLSIIISGGQAADITKAAELVAGSKSRYMLADKGYDSDGLRNKLKELGIISVIPGRKSRKEEIVYDKALYKGRNAIERFFGRIKEYRRIATRYDKTGIMYRGAVILGCIYIWLKV
jgi:transposase